jgi:hypothetical protein
MTESHAESDYNSVEGEPIPDLGAVCKMIRGQGLKTILK